MCAGCLPHKLFAHRLLVTELLCEVNLTLFVAECEPASTLAGHAVGALAMNTELVVTPLLRAVANGPGVQFRHKLRVLPSATCESCVRDHTEHDLLALSDGASVLVNFDLFPELNHGELGIPLCWVDLPPPPANRHKKHDHPCAQRMFPVRLVHHPHVPDRHMVLDSLYVSAGVLSSGFMPLFIFNLLPLLLWPPAFVIIMVCALSSVS